MKHYVKHQATLALSTAILSALAFANLAVAQDKAAYSISPAEEKFDVSNQDWLHPGWDGTLEASVDDNGNQGAMITMFMQKDGLAICAQTENQADNVINGELHCNGRLTPIGFAIPPQWIFKGESSFKHYGKLIIGVLPGALAQVSLGAATTTASVINNTIPMDPVGVFRAERSLQRGGEVLADIARDNSTKRDKVIPVAPMEFRITQLIPAVNDRIARFVKHCNEVANPESPNEKDPAYHFCKLQKGNHARALTVGYVCGIPTQPLSVGEPSQVDLWRPGQPLPAGCAAALAKYDGVDNDGDTNWDDEADLNLIIARAHLADKRYQKLEKKKQERAAKAGTPAVDPADVIDPETDEAYTGGKRLLRWARQFQVDEYLAKRARTPKGRERALADMEKFRNDYQRDHKIADELANYQWLISDKVAPGQKDPAPAPAAAGGGN